MKSLRKQKALLRKFKNACWVLHEKGMSVEDRHNIFCDCVDRANTKRRNSTEEELKNGNFLAQQYFIEAVVRDYAEWFEGAKL